MLFISEKKMRKSPLYVIVGLTKYANNGKGDFLMQGNHNTSRVKIQGINPRKIEKGEIVQMTIQGDSYVDVLKMDRQIGATVRRLDKDHYCVLSTGEIKEYSQDKTMEKDKKNLRKTFAHLRQLIRTNFTKDASNQLFITLTYKENMIDEKQLMRDFDVFYKRLKRRLKGHKLDYIAVAEPQERGAWHFHLMLKSDQPVLYIDNKVLSEVWGHGYTDTQRLKSDDVGSYYAAYFTDLLSNNTKGSKKRKKGARLSLYPKGFKFYRTSRGIKKPDKVYAEYEQLEKCGYKKTYEVAFELINEDREESDRVVNILQKEVWKKVGENGMYSFLYEQMKN